ncbi:hypothetical protein PanWU01x14_140340 [Parasponia andersonii]|uniref:Uncharacterized protein n=1 Tax=Parasponia andersonii TaxID=3476 RepID=A0A2P5CMC4_PARAD|nr:hypothetical protein PanWU01x14_140340 [Parasponia andersonii]
MVLLGWKTLYGVVICCPPQFNSTRWRR